MNSARQSRQLAFKSQLFLMVSLCLPSCSFAPIMTDKDTSDVLEQVVLAEAKLGSDFCVRDELKTMEGSLEGKPGWGGWITSPRQSDLKYRALFSTNGKTFTTSSMRKYSKLDKRCDGHTYVFYRPHFIQVEKGTDTFIEATVSFYNDCGACGYGRFVSLRKTKAGWTIEPPGIRNTWVA